MIAREVAIAQAKILRSAAEQCPVPQVRAIFKLLAMEFDRAARQLDGADEGEAAIVFARDLMPRMDILDYEAVPVVRVIAKATGSVAVQVLAENPDAQWLEFVLPISPVAVKL